MCSAATIGVASFAQSFMGQRAQAQAQYQSEMAQYNQAMAQWEIDKRQAQDRQNMLDANAMLQWQQANAAQQEINEAAAEEKSEIARELMRAREQALLAAGEAGITGNSVDRILSDIGFTEQSKLGAIESGRANQINQIQSEKHNIKQSAETAPIYSAIQKPQYQGNNFASFLSAAVSGFSAYASNYRPGTNASYCGTTRTNPRRCY